MMVMIVRGRVVHVERQYTNADEIWQALECFGIHRIANTLQLRHKCKRFTQMRCAHSHCSSGWDIKVVVTKNGICAVDGKFHKARQSKGEDITHSVLPST